MLPICSYDKINNLKVGALNGFKRFAGMVTIKRGTLSITGYMLK